MPLAEEYSVASRAALIALAVLGSLASAGVIFGFQSLRPALVSSGVYSDLCRSDEPQPCTAQVLKLNLIFAVASTGANIASLPIGACLDRYGPRTTVLVGSLLCVLGNVLFGLSGPAFDGYLTGFTMLGIGGPFVFIGCLHISTVFPASSGLIMAAMTGAFDASSSIYYFFTIILDKIGGSVHRLFLMYALIPISIAIATAALMPRNSFGQTDAKVAEDVHAEEAAETDALLPPCPSVVSSEDPFWDQFKSIEFWGITATICISMLRLNFYISSVEEQAYDLSSGSASRGEVKALTAFFNVALPAAGIISIPGIGYLLDNFSFPTSFGVLWACGVAFGALGLVHNIPLQYVTVCIFVVMRPLLYTLGNDFCFKTFGSRTFGRLYGIMNAIAGVLNLLQYPLNYIALDLMSGSFWLANTILLGIVGVVLAALPLYLARSRTVAAPAAV
ncbi:major facilitator superfamily domain-containing protein [Geranomyces variabilis]|nr:major facilitator superfamily domain-containing protein [Geranomyces variabilis]KAJ3142157.1 hypothetical protein HDU90_004430 [Geranomyces variabilis]